jgi:hypothetical protein
MKGLAGYLGSHAAGRLMFTPRPMGEHSVRRERAVEVLELAWTPGLASSLPQPRARVERARPAGSDPGALLTLQFSRQRSPVLKNKHRHTDTRI